MLVASSALLENLHSMHGTDAVSHLSTAAAYFCVKQKYVSEGYTDVPLRQVERRKMLGAFFFYQDARDFCALLGFALISRELKNGRAVFLL